MRSPVDVVKQVALTLYYLSDEAYFFLTFSVDLDIFSSDKLQASTVYTSQ